jgi:hypothetical protein
MAIKTPVLLKSRFALKPISYNCKAKKIMMHIFFYTKMFKKMRIKQIQFSYF